MNLVGVDSKHKAIEMNAAARAASHGMVGAVGQMIIIMAYPQLKHTSDHLHSLFNLISHRDDRLYRLIFSREHSTRSLQGPGHGPITPCPSLSILWQLL